MNLIFFDNGVKGHLVPYGLGRAVSQDIWDRHKAVGGLGINKDNTVFRIDRGGAMLMDAEWVAVELEAGTVLEVPVRDIENYYLRLLEAKPRVLEDGRHFFKLHGHVHVVVLTCAMRKRVLRAWSMKIGEYRAKADRERQRFTAAVQSVQAQQVLAAWRRVTAVGSQALN